MLPITTNGVRTWGKGVRDVSREGESNMFCEKEGLSHSLLLFWVQTKKNTIKKHT